MLGRTLTLARRLRGRSATELADRARALGWRWLERAGVVGGPSALTEAAITRTLRAGMTPTAAAAAFRANLPTAVFPALAHPAATRDLALGPLAEAVRPLLARADEVLAGRFDVLGLGPLDYGSPPHRHRDPVAGLTAPRRHWTRVPYLDAALVGDHKVTWELNRHQHLLTLAEAWWLTREPRYAERCVALLRHWMDENPPGIGINWASSLELALRSLSWYWLLPMLRDAEALDDATLGRALAVLPLHAAGIERHLSTWFAPNTHLTGEALGLLAAGLFLPHDRRADRWRQRGWRILRERLPMQVLDDGSYFEFSTYYQRYTADIYLHAVRLAEAAGEPVPADWLARLERVLDVLAWAARADGRLPLVGDDDGGRLLPLDASAFDDVRPTLQHGALRFGRADLAALGGPPSLELLFLAGPEGVARYEHLRGAPPAGTARAFAHGGFVALRSGWDPSADTALLVAGPRRWLRLRSHLDADALALDVSVRGRPMLVDPGTGRYVGPLRDHLRAAEAHNAPRLASRSPARMSHAFSWEELPDGRIERIVAGDGFTWVSASHDGYAPAVMRREILHLHDTGWFLRDTLDGHAADDAVIHFRTAAGVAATPRAATAVALSNGEARLILHAFGDDLYVDVGDEEVSPLYGRVMRTPAVTLRGRLGAGAEIVTFLAAGAAVDAEVTGRRERGWRLHARGTAQERIVGCGGGLTVPGHEIRTDAAWISLDRSAPDAPFTAVLALGARRVEIDGETIADLPAAAAWLRARRTHDGWVLQSAAPTT